MIGIVSYECTVMSSSMSSEPVPHLVTNFSKSTQIPVIGPNWTKKYNYISMLKQDESNGTFMFKTGILLTLCIQNAGHALLTRYSQGILRESYSTTEVVLFGELLKLIFSGYISITDKSETDAVGVGFNKLLWLIVNSKKIIILVILYTIANILSYYALARVEAATYTVLLQLKIFTTAAFAVLMLGRNISSSKWRALLLLVLGCILVASPAYNQPKDCSLKVDTENDYDNPRSLLTSCLGIFSILIMVAISGFSAIYFEQMLKQQGTKVTIWERNFQLAFYSIIFLIAIVTWEKVNYNEDMDFNIGEGWTINTFLIAIIQAGGGLLVAATLKYADAILKTLATSGAIVISTLIGYFLLNGVLDIFVIIGSVSTILAIFNYTLE